MGPLSDDPRVRRWFAGRRALVIGLGRSGEAAARILALAGARVAVTESRPADAVRDAVDRLPPGVSVETGSHERLKDPWDLAIISPGIPPSIGAGLRARGIPLWGEIELAYRALRLAGRWPERTAVVTGTNGKTTTTALLAAMFRAAGGPVAVGGNIGTPLCDLADRLDPRGWLALEVSSYQLETVRAFRPAAGAVLNLTPDHLGRHGTMARYAQAKARLFGVQGPEDAAVLNAEDPWCRRMAGAVGARVLWFGARIPGPGVRWDGRRIRADMTGGGSWPGPARLSGRHNIMNALAAVACARALGVPASAVERSLATFPGVEHRLETVRRWRGVLFVNDSKSTNVDSTRVALEAIPGPLWLILGGRGKGAPYAALRRALGRRTRALLLIGEDAGTIERDLRGAAPAVRCGTLDAAVARAAETARPGETVLLSPACASFDQFRDFEHRGREFKRMVNAL